MTSVGLTYADDCYTMALSYVSNYALSTYSTESSNAVMLTIGLRTLGQTSSRARSEATTCGAVFRRALSGASSPGENPLRAANPRQTDCLERHLAVLRP